MSGERLPIDLEKGQQNARQVRAIIAYYLALLLLVFAALFDTWSRSFIVLRWLRVSPELFEAPMLRTVGFTVIGGMVGSILFQIRMLYSFYAKAADNETDPKKKYNPRWVGKYVTAPWESAAMSLVVLSLIRGGVTLFGGSSGLDVSGTNNFAAFSTGALVGFGMRDVVKWVQRLVQTMFASENNGSKDKDARPPSDIHGSDESSAK